MAPLVQPAMCMWRRGCRKGFARWTEDRLVSVTARLHARCGTHRTCGISPHERESEITWHLRLRRQTERVWHIVGSSRWRHGQTRQWARRSSHREHADLRSGMNFGKLEECASSVPSPSSLFSSLTTTARACRLRSSMQPGKSYVGFAREDVWKLARLDAGRTRDEH